MSEFEITADAAGQHASNGQVAVSLLADGAGRMFKRNAIKNACTAEARKVQWLVAELDGVRVYAQSQDGLVNVVIAKRDLYP